MHDDHPQLTTANHEPTIICQFSLHTGWWYTYPSEKYEFVSWDDEIPNMEKIKNVPKHQPDINPHVFDGCSYASIRAPRGWTSGHLSSHRSFASRKAGPNGMPVLQLSPWKMDLLEHVFLCFPFMAPKT